MNRKKGIVLTILISVFLILYPVKAYAEGDGETISIQESSHIIQEQQEDLDIIYDNDIRPYQSKRILVFTDSMDGEYGEIEKYYVEDADYYLLYFETEKDTKSAYERLIKKYPDKVLIDQDLSQDIFLDYLSYGTTTTGMDSLYENIDNTPYKNQKVTVAVIDTGCNTTHPLFEGRLSSQSYDIANGDKDVSEETSLTTNKNVGHGSHVTGIVASSTPANVEIMPLKIFDKKGNIYPSYLINAVSYALNNDVDIINLSLGITGDYDFIDELIEKAYEQKCIIVAAAGNEANKSGYDKKLAYPASNEKTISVGAITENKARCAFSNYNEKLDFVAPGNSIISVAKSGTGSSTLSGTSMAAPFVSAEIAYIKMKYPKASFTECYDLLKSYSEDLGTEGFDIYYGWGMPDVRNLFANAEQSTSIVDAVITYKDSWEYCGSEIKPEVCLKIGDQVLTPGTDYTVYYENNISAGTGKIKIYGRGEYYGTISRYFTIKPKDISAYSICTIQQVYDYTGQEVKPDIDIPGLTLDDYKVTYFNNIEPGVAYILFEGINNYCGEIRVPFTIYKANFNPNKGQTTVSLIGRKFQTGKFIYQITGDNTVKLTKMVNNPKTIRVPDTVSYQRKTYKITKIENKVFYKKACKKVVLGTYIIQIGSKAFAKCKKLKYIVLKGKQLKSVGKGTSKKVIIKCPKSVFKKYRKIWKGYTVKKYE